jgi:tetratricopeptide (TPR) repeat protein
MKPNLTIIANTVKLCLIPALLFGWGSLAHAQSSSSNQNNNSGLNTSAESVATVNNSKVPRGIETRLLFLALAGELSAGAQNYVDASDAYLRAAKTYPDEQFFEKSVNFAMNAKSIDRVITSSRAWIKAYPKSEVPYLHLSTALISLKQYKASTEAYKNALALANPDNQATIIREVIRLYALTPEGLNEISALEAILLPYTQKPNTAEVTWFVLGALRLENNQLDAAFEALQNLPLLQTESSEFNYLAFNLLKNNHAPTQVWLEDKLQKNFNSALFRAYYQWQRTNMPSSALLKTLNSLAAADNPPAEVLVYLGELEADYLFWSKAKTSFLKAQKNLVFEKDAKKKQLLQEYLNLKLAEVAIAQKRFNEVTPLLSSVMDVSLVESKLKIETQYLIAANKIQEAYELLNSSILPPEQKEQVWIRMLEKQNQFEKALVATEKALKTQTKDNSLLFKKASLLGQVGRTKESIQLHQQLIKKDAKNAQLLNSLGFMLAEKGIELNYAQQSIKSALLIAPNNFMYLDSLAWVKFKKGEYKEALQLLQQAFAAEPHPEIGAHLGEVLWVMGQKSEALAVWKQSYDQSAPYDVLIKTLERYKQTIAD